MQVQTMVQWNFKQRYTIKPHKCSHCSQWNKVCLRPKKYTYVILQSWILAWVIVIILTAIRLTIFVLVLLFVSIFMLEVHVLKTNPVKPPDEGCVPKPLGGIKSSKSVNSLTHVILLVLELFSTSGCSSMREQHTGQQSKVTFTTSHTNSCEIGESDSRHGVLLDRKLLFSLHSQTWHARKSMHCPHKSPRFLSIQETHSLAPDILQVSVCLWDCSANQNMFINENKHKNVTLSVRHLLSESEIESGCVMNVV